MHDAVLRARRRFCCCRRCSRPFEECTNLGTRCDACRINQRKNVESLATFYVSECVCFVSTILTQRWAPSSPNQISLLANIPFDRFGLREEKNVFAKL